jgi:nucleoside-diphosphate-sugar epimerase
MGNPVVLVTGATGSFGRWAPAKLAARGYEVHGVHWERDAGDEDINWHRVSLLEPGAGPALMREVRPTHLLHLAWVTGEGHRSSPLNLLWVAESIALLREFQAVGGRRAVLAGSAAEYAPGPRPHGEDEPAGPRTLYASAKHGLRTVAERFCAENGVGFAWARAFPVFGPGDDPGRLISGVIRALQSGEPADCSGGRQRIDFLYTLDAAEAFVRLLDSDVSGAVNIGSGTAHSVLDVVTLIGELLERPDLLRVGALPRRVDEADYLGADIGRLIRNVGYTPATSLEDGLRRAALWWAAETQPAAFDPA